MPHLAAISDGGSLVRTIVGKLHADEALGVVLSNDCSAPGDLWIGKESPVRGAPGEGLRQKVGGVGSGM